jgi:nucleotide-binding universal stress UspA family protein
LQDGAQIQDGVLSQTDREEVGRIQQRLGKDGRVLFAGGNIPEAVCSQAKKLQADLLVIGRSPKADDVGAARTASSTIVRESPCPVVSI